MSHPVVSVLLTKQEMVALRLAALVWLDRHPTAEMEPPMLDALDTLEHILEGLAAGPFVAKGASHG